MYRSFSDRVFAGLCGGLAARLPVSAWILRVLVILGAVVSGGAVAVLYLMLWMLIPQETLAARQSGGGLWLLVALLLTVLVGAGYYGAQNGLLLAENGANLYPPLMALLFALLFFLKQLGRSA